MYDQNGIIVWLVAKHKGNLIIPQNIAVCFEKHWHLDEQRYHADPRAIHFIRLFSQVSYEKVQNIQVKKKLRKVFEKRLICYTMNMLVCT